ncbi:cell division protein FtsX [Novosphingopyxis sp. YJ-S2-01]|uniref:cell division protein FtsX n=1 Tax=Novosphingopyxis sp. YJ-S2-01 TaxID=2794021 RepID=UPI0018DCC929|nr:FtsX-like permease family protein [Novosphingopyxis sp. YJ-S2-01]MBH9536676.1 cell division protein [Novosphingopyxis sp. YJ-S2-01]
MAIRSALPAQDRNLMPEGRLSGPMPWVIAIMVFLTVLAAAAGLLLASASADMGQELARQATVQVLAAEPRERDAEQARALSALRALPQVTDAASVPPAKVEQLLAPWFGGASIASELPIPALIDVTLTGPADAGALQRLRVALERAAPSARVDADGAWLAPVRGALQSLQWLAAALIVLLGIATAATVVLAARSSLGNHRETIAIVHLLGGTDHQISRLFQRRMALDAAFGAILGFVASAALLYALSRQFLELDTPLVPVVGASPLLFAVLLVIPVVTVLLAVLMARLTILGALRKML